MQCLVVKIIFILNFFNLPHKIVDCWIIWPPFGSSFITWLNFFDEMERTIIFTYVILKASECPEDEYLFEKSLLYVNVEEQIPCWALHDNFLMNCVFHYDA